MAGRLERVPYRVWVLCGDSELAEGSIWEAAEHAGSEGLANLTAIVDVNRLGQRGPTRHGWDTGAYARRFGAFGWHTIEIDGHDPGQIDYALSDARNTRRRPTVILAKTRKGEGVLEVENREGAHGKALKDPGKAVQELGGPRSVRVEVHKPEVDAAPFRFGSNGMALPSYPVGEKVATRTAYGAALAALGSARGDVVALDGEVADSTKTETFGKEHPERFFEMYIAEQQLVAAAVGLQVRGWKPYAATFAAFLTRAHDFIRMAGVSRADIRLVGSHAGVAIGEDGPSQMGLEDLAMMRTVHGSTVLYPCDANQTVALIAEMADLEGVSYLRTTRGDTPVIYQPGERFPVGGSRVLRQSPGDRATIVAAGVTVHEALAAADDLQADGVRVGVIDLYSIKPVDTAALVEAATTTGNLITVEDHRIEGGLGDAVMDAVSELGPRVVKLAVTDLPGSATPQEQLADARIDRHAIADAVKRLL
jgi:transketolase